MCKLINIGATEITLQPTSASLSMVNCLPLFIIKILPHHVYALEVDSPCDKNEEMWQKGNDFPKGRRITGFGLAALTTGL